VADHYCMPLPALPLVPFSAEVTRWRALVNRPNPQSKKRDRYGHSIMHSCGSLVLSAHLELCAWWIAIAFEFNSFSIVFYLRLDVLWFSGARTVCIMLVLKFDVDMWFLERWPSPANSLASTISWLGGVCSSTQCLLHVSPARRAPTITHVQYWLLCFWTRVLRSGLQSYASKEFPSPWAFRFSLGIQWDGSSSWGAVVRPSLVSRIGCRSGFWRGALGHSWRWRCSWLRLTFVLPLTVVALEAPWARVRGPVILHSWKMFIV